MQLTSNPAVKTVFDNYPKRVQSRMRHLRKLVLETAKEVESVEHLEETLKWGEPSYLTKHGSTIRMDWKMKTSDQYAMYFKCTSQLVPTFKEVYGDLLTFEGDRAIVFQLDDPVPDAELKQCIKAGLTYHKVKHLDSLGM
jgi:hypothetical protein